MQKNKFEIRKQSFELGLTIQEVGAMMGFSKSTLYKHHILAKLKADGLQSFTVAGQERFLASSVAELMRKSAITGRPIGEIKRRRRQSG